MEKASITDSKRVVAICAQGAQRGMCSIFLTIVLSTPTFAFAEPHFFIGDLVSIALSGLFQAVFMANAGGARDNAKKVVETELHAKNTPLHAATVVGDPFEDTSSVAMNPAIKCTALFGLLAVELAVSLGQESPSANTLLAVLCFGISVVFVFRSFYGMRIKND